MGRSPTLAEAIGRIPPGRRHGRGTVLGVLLGATLMGALFGSGPLLAWAEDHEELVPLLPALTAWDEAMQWLGPGRLHPTVRAAARRLEG